ncbi:hypothetical protein BH10CHL1_BH10CHL1_33680 [soil metagenome]
MVFTSKPNLNIPERVGAVSDGKYTNVIRLPYVTCRLPVVYAMQAHRLAYKPCESLQI